MNEISLSELQQITVEIRVLKQQTAQNIIEIGNRLIAAKAQVKHGEWMHWLESEVEISQWSANKFMKAASEFSNYGSVNNLSPTKVLALLDLPEEERATFVDKPHTIPSTGETKTVDEMTVRELREVKAQLKKTQEELQATNQQAASIMERDRQLREENERLKREKNPAPQVVERQVEVYPKDYERTLREHQELNTKNVQLSIQIEELQRSYEQKLRDVKDGDTKTVKRQLRQALDQHLQNIQTLHSSGLFLYRMVEGQKDAVQMVRSFLSQFDDITDKQRDDWNRVLQVNGEDEAEWITV